jgi:hypothetical protein
MKKFTQITFFLFFVGALTAQVQVPFRLSYQAVIRNANNALVSNSVIAMRLSIVQGSATGTAIYTETQSPLSNQNGLVSIEIGGGAVVLGNFNTIDWSAGPFYIRVETDPTGGTNYSILGTSPLLSVPYALHAKTAESIAGGPGESDPIFSSSVSAGITSMDTLYWSQKQDPVSAGPGILINNNVIRTMPKSFYLGQDTLGGIVFYLYEDSVGNQRGLIVSKTETVSQWQTVGSPTGAVRSWDGVFNTGAMSSSPAKAWITSNFSSEWYLPSRDELSLLWHSLFHVNRRLFVLGLTPIPATGFYWSSTESNASNAVYFDFFYGSAFSTGKTSSNNVRAIRGF